MLARGTLVSLPSGGFCTPLRLLGPAAARTALARPGGGLRWQHEQPQWRAAPSGGKAGDSPMEFTGLNPKCVPLLLPLPDPSRLTT